MHTYWTSIFWSIDSCQNRVPADQYHLTVSRAQVSTHRGQVFFWSYPLTRYWFLNDPRLKFNFFKIHMKYVVFICRTIKILISNWPRTWKFSQLLQVGKTVAFDFSRHVHALVTLYVQFLWLVKIWHVSSCGKFMQHLESCLLWQLKLTEFCVNLWCFLLSFSTGRTKWNSAAIRSLLLFMASLFIGFLVESKSEIRFRRASFSFSPCLMRKRVAKSEAILALLDTFQEQHLEW